MFKYVEFTKVKTDHTVLEFRGGNESIKVNHFDRDIVSIESDTEADIDALVNNQPLEINAIFITKEEFKDIAETTAQFERIKEQVDDKYTKDVSILATQYPLHERETWITQLSQAKAFKASSDELEAPFLKILADAESDTVANFADAVILKAQEYETFMALKLVDKRAFEKSLMSEIGL